MELTIRNIEANDIPHIKAVIGNVWNWGDVIEDETVLDATFTIYLNTILDASTFGQVAVLDGKILGFISGIYQGDSPKYKGFKIEKDLGELSEKAIAEYDGVKGYFIALNAAYDELIRHKQANFDGTLDFLVLAKEAQGLGVGKKLWLALKAYFEEKQAQAIYLYTDTDCNYGFYEHLGFHQANALDVDFAIEDEAWETTQFLFTYSFDEKKHE